MNIQSKMSPRTLRQYEEIREEKRALIMDTALLFFANEGYHSTTVSQIAGSAGISKGLMYNYFKSKEDLLKAIISKSIAEVYSYFDINRDGYLSEEEFEFFIRKICTMLKEKRTFWRLLIQLMMQNEVRDQFLKSFVGSDSITNIYLSANPDQLAAQIINSIRDYFFRKKETMGGDYDPLVEINLFIINLKGLALTVTYLEDDDESQEKIINRIIELFK
jgi:AcrR family transcriptional regulator